MRAAAARAHDKATATASVVERVARGQISVLVLGETGVGKEILTRQIHQLSPRAAHPLLRAAGGSEQRQYPWGTIAPGTMNQYAIYDTKYTGNSTNLAPVGTAASGAGKWGQLDLAGQVWEWVLDWKQTYVNPCTDCVNLTPAQFHIVRGDNFGGSLNNLMPIVRGGDVADPGRDSNFGVRCARAP